MAAVEKEDAKTKNLRQLSRFSEKEKINIIIGNVGNKAPALMHNKLGVLNKAPDHRKQRHLQS